MPSALALDFMISWTTFPLPVSCSSVSATAASTRCITVDAREESFCFSDSSAASLRAARRSQKCSSIDKMLSATDLLNCTASSVLPS